MSVHVSSWVWRQAEAVSIGPSDLIVLLALADWADDDGVAFPTQPMLVKRCKVLGDRTVRRSVERLTEAGLLVVKPGSGRGIRSVYRVLWKDAEKVADLTTFSKQKVVTGDAERWSLETGTIKDARVPSENPSDSLSPNGERASGKPTTPPKQEAHPACRAYRRLTGSTLNVARRSVIENALPVDIAGAALERWSEAVTAWVGRGYRRENVTGMLEWWRDGIPERQPQRVNGHVPRRSAVSVITDELRSIQTQENQRAAIAPLGPTDIPARVREVNHQLSHARGIGG